MKPSKILRIVPLLGILALHPGHALAQAGNLLRIVPSCGSQQLYKADSNGQYGPGTVDYFGLTCTPVGSGGGGGGGGTVTQGPAGTSPWLTDIRAWAGTTLASPSAYGTAPSGQVPGFNGFITNFPANQAVSWATAQPINNQLWAGQSLGAPSNYGTAPTGLVPGSNAFVTNFPAVQATKPALTATLSTGQAPVTTTANNVSPANTFVHRGIRSFASNTTPIYFGQTSAVTATTGQRLDPGDYASFDSYSGDIYMIAPSGTATVGVDTN